ncbi:MAG: ATP-dependent Lon protease [Solirubrobacterales bacterium]|jgi:ATP-dependent Lon protease|nr:ATP-dependent Lon protease [Solirubrobacterales bacterium]
MEGNGDGIQVVEASDLEQAIRERGTGPLSAALPVLPLKDTVAYPDTLTPLAVGQERSIRLIDDVLGGERTLVLVASRDPELDEPGPEQLYEVGVVGVVARMLKVPDGTVRILVQATERVRIGDYVTEKPYLVAGIESLPDVVVPSPELEALTRNVQRTFSEIIEQIPYLPEELQLAVTNIDDPSALGHLIAGALRIPTEEKQQLLEEVDVAKRLRRLSELLARELEVIQLGSQIQSEVESEMEKGQRDYYLREQLKAIQRELGEEDETQAEVNELRERIEAAELPEDAAKAAERELSRLERLPAAAAEYGVIRTYLEWLVELPWSQRTTDNLDIGHARDVLDADHYDLEKVKDRILEYLAVRSLNPDSHGPILCFIGPPGVGKTSLGKSIARALGREFERISVGGVRDEAEIRGHRRTYVGAMPGTIIRSLRDAGSRNPVFMIDEIDKMGADFRGDPSSAMLEVLDPAQNDAFRDHYLDLAFDLSEVLFIATANNLETIPGPLLDRMEVIQLAGYTADEKLHIAKRYLVPRQLAENGLRGAGVRFADAALRAIIDEYTREAGVRGLEREIGSVCRKLARVVAEAAPSKKPGKQTVSGKRARELLGRRRVFSETRRRTKDPGVATGLAWTPVGGEVLFVEATVMPGSGKLTITGQLGEVMRESAQAALSWVRGHAAQLNPELSEDWFAEHDIHVHVPAGAVPKDGPSAGVAMTTALTSLIRNRPVSAETAMTGEVTLTGQVLPVGGLKEKSLAALRAGIKRVIVPDRNEGEILEIPAHERSGLEFIYVDHVEKALAAAIDG